jgi:hypothetical protein
VSGFAPPRSVHSRLSLPPIPFPLERATTFAQFLGRSTTSSLDPWSRPVTHRRANCN